MISTRKLGLRRAFAIGPDEITSLCDALSTSGFEVLINVESSDGTSFEKITVDQLLTFPNSPQRSIREIKIHGYKKVDSGEWTYATITLRQKHYLNEVIDIVIRDQDKETSYLLPRLSEIFEANSLWYSRFVVHPLWYMLPLAILNTIIVLALFSIPAIDEAAFLENDKIAKFFAPVVTSVVTIFVLGISLEKLLGWLFPIGNILVGAGKNRYEARIGFRRNVFWGVIVASVIGIAIAYLF